MKAIIAALALAAASGSAAMAQQAAGAPIVFFDIAGPNMARQSAFYQAVFDWKIAPTGTFTAPTTPTMSATLREETNPERLIETMVYMGVPDIKATLAKVVANGGAVVYPRFEVKGVVILGVFKDPAGNRIGLVEMDGPKAKVP